MFMPPFREWVALFRFACRLRKRAFLLCYRESTAGDLFGEGFVEFRVFLFECGTVESVGENRRPSDDVRADCKLFCVLCKHLRFDTVAECFGFGLRFFENGFPFFELFNGGNEFVS